MDLAPQENNKGGQMKAENKKGFIFFIRHGKTDWNNLGLMQGREDIPLNEEGLLEAQNAACHIRAALEKTDFEFDSVISSPLMRASVMGKMIAEKIGCDSFFCDVRATERDFGELSGKKYDKSSPAIMRDVDEYSSLERVDDLLLRVNEFINEYASCEKNILVVTHGAVTRIFADNAKKAPDFEITAPFLNNCHLVAYSYNGTEPILLGYNISPERLDEFLEGI